MMHWGGFNGAGFGGFGLGWIFMALFWIFVVLGVIYILKNLLGGHNTLSGRESAEDILFKRYASGEISEEEFKEKTAVIKNSRVRE